MGTKGFRQGAAALVMLVLMGVILPGNRAAAECTITSTSNGSDDVVVCTAQPPEDDGVETLEGDDRVTIQEGATVSGYISSENAVAIDTGRGSDTVVNYGTIDAPYDGVHLRDGVSDVLQNFGMIDGGDDGVWCSPYNGTHTCTINNYGTIIADNEAIDIYNQGGTAVVYNEGTIISREQEAVHLVGPLKNEVINHGTIQGVRNAIETYGGSMLLYNYGLINSTDQYGVDLDGNNDIVHNVGTIRSFDEPAIDLSSGHDQLHNSGTIQTSNDNELDSVIEGGYGDDYIANAGNIRENGSGFAAIEAGYANDTVVIYGGTIQGLIHGDGDYGTRDGDHDVLIFAMVGTQQDVDSFRASVLSQSSESGKATFRYKTYEWRDFEEIRLNLTVDPNMQPADPPPSQYFADVPTPGKDWMTDWIDKFYAEGMTGGCATNPLRYCPERPVTRAEMAVFILRAKYGRNYDPPTRTSSFADVPTPGKEWMKDWIQRFYSEGITSGCAQDPLRYCPEREVTRGEMAVFILRATHGEDYNPPAAQGIFADVPTQGKEWMAEWIEQLYREGITSGCSQSPLQYCPERSVTRGEMAVFLLRAFDNLGPP